MGIGSTALACKNLKIDFIGFDIDKKYVDIEYDPEQDVTIYRKKRKRGEGEWDDWEDEIDF